MFRLGNLIICLLLNRASTIQKNGRLLVFWGLFAGQVQAEAQAYPLGNFQLGKGPYSAFLALLGPGAHE
jgi:hypothetical protein